MQTELFLKNGYKTRNYFLHILHRKILIEFVCFFFFYIVFVSLILQKD